MMRGAKARGIIVQSTRLAAATIALCLVLGCTSSGDRTLEEIIEETYPVEPTTSISVTNRDGSIRIYGADTAEVRTQAIKKAYTAQRLKAILIHASAQRSSVSIETTYPPKPRWGFSDRSGAVDYVIVVPQTANISRLKLENGEVLVEGMRSRNAHARLGTGRLFAHNCFGNLNLAVSTGNLALIWDWWEESEFYASATIESGNGIAYIPGDASFHLIARAAKGKIANDFVEKEQRRAEPIGKIDMLVGGESKATIKIEASDGNIKIAEQNP